MSSTWTQYAIFLFLDPTSVSLPHQYPEPTISTIKGLVHCTIAEPSHKKYQRKIVLKKWCVILGECGLE